MVVTVEMGKGVVVDWWLFVEKGKRVMVVTVEMEEWWWCLCKWRSGGCDCRN